MLEVVSNLEHNFVKINVPIGSVIDEPSSIVDYQIWKDNNEIIIKISSKEEDIEDILGYMRDFVSMNISKDDIKIHILKEIIFRRLNIM